MNKYIYILLFIQVTRIAALHLLWKNESYQEAGIDSTGFIRKMEEKADNAVNSNNLPNDNLRKISKILNVFKNKQEVWNKENNLNQNDMRILMEKKHVNKRDLLSELPKIPSTELPKLPSLPKIDIPEIPSLELPKLPEISPEDLLQMPKLEIPIINFPDLLDISSLNKEEKLSSGKPELISPSKNLLRRIKKDADSDSMKKFKNNNLLTKVTNEESKTIFYRKPIKLGLISLPTVFITPISKVQILKEGNKNNERRGRKIKCDGEKITYKEIIKIVIHEKESDESKDKGIIPKILSKLPNPLSDLFSLSPSIETEKGSARRKQTKPRDEECVEEVAYEDEEEIVIYDDSEELPKRKFMRSKTEGKNPLISTTVFSQLSKPLTIFSSKLNPKIGDSSGMKELQLKGNRKDRNKRNINQLQVEEQVLYKTGTDDYEKKSNKKLHKIDLNSQKQTEKEDEVEDDIAETEDDDIAVVEDDYYDTAEEEEEEDNETSKKDRYDSVDDEINTKEHLSYYYDDVSKDKDIIMKCNKGLNKKNVKCDYNYDDVNEYNLKRGKREMRIEEKRFKPSYIENINEKSSSLNPEIHNVNVMTLLKQIKNKNTLVSYNKNENLLERRKIKLTNEYEYEYDLNQKDKTNKIKKKIVDAIDNNYKIADYKNVGININKREVDSDSNTVEGKVTDVDVKPTQTEKETTTKTQVEIEEKADSSDENNTKKEQLTTTTSTTTISSTESQTEETTEYEYETEDENCPKDMFGTILNGLKCVFNFITSQTIGIEIGPGCC
ncbi:uncharacterized protein LOC142327093 [Lycorma delicatula]|uniref:uncharacterized protein LOC142327093 n=1 Tax=Lycorma delicatula TaxID=130591 RepID=UPI003F5186DF